MYTYTHPFYNLFHSRSLQDPEYSSVYYIVGPCCLCFIYSSLYMLIPNS